MDPSIAMNEFYLQFWVANIISVDKNASTDAVVLVCILFLPSTILTFPRQSGRHGGDITSEQ